MREIKFRAWDKEKRKIVDAMWRMSIDMNGNITWLVDHYDGNLRLKEREETEGNDRFELMQYTGLKDKNGKEIYEGDIVGKVGICVGKVIYGEYHDNGDLDGPVDFVGFYIKWDDGSECFADFKKYEVIGNIYENPDLMRVPI